MVLDAEGQWRGVGVFSGQFDLLCADREVSIRGNRLFDPDRSQGQAVDYDLAGSVSDHIDYGTGGIEEVGAVGLLAELQRFEVTFALDLDAEACTSQGIPGLRIDLQDLQTGGTVLNGHDLRIGYTVLVGQGERDRFGSDITSRSDLFQGVSASRQIPEFDEAVFVGEEGVLAIPCPDAEAVLGRSCGYSLCALHCRGFRLRVVDNSSNRLTIRIKQAELNIRKRLSGVQIQLIDLQADRLIRNVGRAGDVAVVVNGECERLGIQRETLCSNGLLECVGAGGQLIQDDLTVQIGRILEYHFAFGVRDLDDSLVYGLSGRQIGLLQNDVRLLIGTFEHDRGFVIRRDLDLDHFIGDDEARRRDDLLHVVGSDRQVDRKGVTVLVGDHGVVQQSVLIPDFILCAFQHASRIGIIFFPDREIAFETLVLDGRFEVVGVRTFDCNGEGFLDQMDRWIRDLQFLQVVLAERQRSYGSCNAVLISRKQVHQRVLRDHGDVLRGVQSEDSAFQRTGLEGHRGRIKELRDLLDLHRTGNPFVIGFDLCVNDRGVLILIRDRDGMNRGIEIITGDCLGFLHRVCAKREQRSFRNAVLIRNDRSYDGSGGVLDYELATGEAFDLILRSMQLTVFGRRRGRAGQDIRCFGDLDRAFGGFVLQFQCCRFADFNDHGMRETIHNIRFDSGKFLDVVRSCVQFRNGHGAVSAGGNFLDLVGAVRVLIDPELDAGQRSAVVTDLLDLQCTESRRVDADARGRHDLRCSRAQEDLLQGGVRRNIRRNIIQRPGVFPRSGKGERLASRGGRGGDGKLFTLGTSVPRYGDTGRELGGVERIAGVDVGELNGGLACEGITTLRQSQRGRCELDAMIQCLFVTCHL